jgi:hypothetical protein
VVVITTPDPMYRALEARDFVQGGPRNVTVVDCWRLLASKLNGQAGITYVPVGRSVDDARNTARLSALWTT